MQVNAICEDGIIRFPQTMRFKHRQFRVIVDLPESEIDATAIPAVTPVETATVDAPQTAGSLYLSQIQAILGPQFHPRPKGSVQGDRAAYIDALAEKYER